MNQDDSKLRKRAGKADGETQTKVYKERKRYPPIGDMLAYGAPEEAGKEKTFLEKVAGPAVLAILFVTSFFIFMNAPHHLSKGNERKGFAMNQPPPQKKMKPPQWEDYIVEKPLFKEAKLKRSETEN